MGLDEIKSKVVEKKDKIVEKTKSKTGKCEQNPTVLKVHKFFTTADKKETYCIYCGKNQ